MLSALSAAATGLSATAPAVVAAPSAGNRVPARAVAQKPANSETADKKNTGAGRRRRGRQKVRDIVKIPGTDEVEIKCIHGCGCTYRTKVFSVDKDAWHKALRCINAHESQRCPLNKNSTRCYNRKSDAKSTPAGPTKRKGIDEDSIMPGAKKTGSIESHRQMNAAQAQAAFLAQQHAQMQQQQMFISQQQQRFVQPQMPVGVGMPQVVYGMIPTPAYVAPQQYQSMQQQQQQQQQPQQAQQRQPQQQQPLHQHQASEQCSQSCRYRRATAELMIENAKLKEDCARLKNLLNSVSTHLASESNKQQPQRLQQKPKLEPQYGMPVQQQQPQQQQQQPRYATQQPMYSVAQTHPMYAQMMQPMSAQQIRDVQQR